MVTYWTDVKMVARLSCGWRNICFFILSLILRVKFYLKKNYNSEVACFSKIYYHEPLNDGNVATISQVRAPAKLVLPIVEIYDIRVDSDSRMLSKFVNRFQV